MKQLELQLPGDYEKIKSPITQPGFENLGAIVSKFLPYILGIAGLVLLLFLVMAGFQYLTSGGDPKATQSAQEKMTSAVVGFILLFTAYWLFQILGILMGLDFFKPGI